MSLRQSAVHDLRSASAFRQRKLGTPAQHLFHCATTELNVYFQPIPRISAQPCLACTLAHVVTTYQDGQFYESMKIRLSGNIGAHLTISQPPSQMSSSSINVFALGASRNIGYYSAIRLLGDSTMIWCPHILVTDIQTGTHREGGYDYVPFTFTQRVRRRQHDTTLREIRACTTLAR